MKYPRLEETIVSFFKYIPRSNTIKDTIEPINRTIPRSPAFIKML